jgi:hypothetical protein
MRYSVRQLAVWAIAGTALLMVCVYPATEADAIPAFARKYSMSCTTCHAPIPRLKEYGDEFAGNGFVLEDKDAPRYFVETGDERLDLIRDLPIAVRFEGFLKHDTRTDKELDFTTPYNLKLLSGGTLTRNIAYYFYFFFSERGEVAGIEDAYLMFNNLGGEELDLYVGQFQVSDPLFKREVRLTYEDYQIYKTFVGASQIALTYDRGIMVTYGHSSGFDAIVEVINGNGIGEADADRVYDEDKYKNFAGRLSQGIGDHVRIGGFGYYGKEGELAANEVWMAGGDATLTIPKFQLNLQYLERRDDNPYFLPSPIDEVETRGGFAELVIMPDGDRSRWYGVALYNRVESDLCSHNYETVSGHIGYVLRTNIRLMLEDTYDTITDDNKFVLGTVVAF